MSEQGQFETRIVLHPEHEIDPVVTTQRLRIMKYVRSNVRLTQMEQDGVLRPTPLLDAAIERLEELLSIHLPGKETV